MWDWECQTDFFSNSFKFAALGFKIIFWKIWHRQSNGLSWKKWQKNLTLWLLDDLWKTLEWFGMTVKWLGITWLTLGWPDLFLIDFGMVSVHKYDFGLTLNWLCVGFGIELWVCFGMTWLTLSLWKRAFQKIQTEL